MSPVDMRAAWDHSHQTPWQGMAAIAELQTSVGNSFKAFAAGAQ